MNNPQPEHEEWKWTSLNEINFHENGDLVYNSSLDAECDFAGREGILFHEAHWPVDEAHAQAIVTAHNLMPEVVEVIERLLINFECFCEYADNKPGEHCASCLVSIARDLLARIGGGE